MFDKNVLENILIMYIYDNQSILLLSFIYIFFLFLNQHFDTVPKKNI